MNPPVGSRLLAALLCASALFTVAAASLPRFDLAVAAPFMNPSESPERSRAAMVERIGPPSRRLRAAVWIYYRCRAIGMPPVVGEGADIGVVNVSAGAITDLGLLNEETLRVLVQLSSSSLPV